MFSMGCLVSMRLTLRRASLAGNPEELEATLRGLENPRGLQNQMLSESSSVMAGRGKGTEVSPFGWVEISDSALRRLRSELEVKGQGVVDEMGVLAIHAGYADYFFPGTSVLQTRPRYLFFTCWNFLWLAQQRGVTAANFLKRKDEAELWVTSQLVATTRRASATGKSPPIMDGIIGVRVFSEDPPRVPAQCIDFIYWTAIRRWSFYKSRLAQNRTELFRRWRGTAIKRVGEGLDECRDDAIRDEPLGEFLVPPIPKGWQSEDSEGLDFELTGTEATWLQNRLLGLKEVAEGPCLLAKAAELCAELPPGMLPEDESSLRPWDDRLAVQSARATGQFDRLERARQASRLGHYVRAIYAALVERLVEVTASTRRDPPLRHYRELLRELAEDGAMRAEALALPLTALYSDVPRIPGSLRNCLRHVQDGLRRVASGEDAETVFVSEITRRLFEVVERSRKGNRARLTRTEQGAARRTGFDRDTIGVYDIDYRWNRIRYLLWDLHHGLRRA